MIAVIDYKAGNLYSVGNALAYLNTNFVFSGDPEVVSRAQKVILPGVGSARAAMQSLNDQRLVEVLTKLQVPFLGICLGLQLLFEKSEEDNTPCLGLLPGTIRKLDSTAVKVPHIGWNQVVQHSRESNASALFEKVPDGTFFYFVHSYCALATDEVAGRTQYGNWFASAVSRDNFWGVQFHPERSGDVGLRVLKNFLELG